MEYTEEDLMGQVLTDRIDQILQKENKKNKMIYQEQEAILDSLDEEIRKKFEDFATSVLTANSNDCQKVYREAFLDGLRLGHKAF